MSWFSDTWARTRVRAQGNTGRLYPVKRSHTPCTPLAGSCRALRCDGWAARWCREGEEYLRGL